MNTYINPKAIENKSITKDKLSDDLIFDIKGEIPKNEIWYTSSDGMVEPNDSAFSGSIVSNTYKNGKYIIKFDRDITSIGKDAFKYCNYLTSVTIPNSVTSIGNYAFYGCNELASITIPDSVTSIGNYAFYGCNELVSITIPDSVTSIGGYAFYGCSSLTSVTIPDSVTSIYGGAFEGCESLTSVTIGNSVTTIGNSAFYYCSSLISIAMPDSVTSIGDYAFCGCTSLISITIPDSVTSIGMDAFSGCKSLTSVTIGNSVTEIGYEVFSNCSGLTSVAIPDSVTSIRSWAFSGCSSLTSVTIPDSVTSIGEGTFEYCYSLKSITIGKSVNWIGYDAFYECTTIEDIYCKATTPPSLESYDSYLESSKIHVPINSLDEYKSETNWSEYADNVFGVVFEDDNLISGQNIKTINGISIIGEGDIATSPMVEITYDKLKSLRNISKLVPGQQYRITDYITTTSQKYTYSAEHQFDIIVTALSENTLSEEAKAIQHDGDNYFANSNLSAWKIWYSLDNDTNRFSWAGKQRDEVCYESCNIDTSRCVLTIPSNDPEDDGKCELKNMVRAVGTILGDSTTNGWYDTNKNEIFSHYSYEEDNNGVMQLTLHSRYFDGDLNGDYTIGGFGLSYHYQGIIEIEGNEYSVWREYEGSGNYAEWVDGGKIYLLTDKITKGKIKRFDGVIDETVYINPKGVIYRMIDEWNNDCPYDFKNIMFTRIATHNGCLATGSEFEGYNNVFCYTFGFYDGDTYVDASVFGNTTGVNEGVYNNIIKTFNSLEYGENDDSILDSGSDSGLDDYISQQYIQQSLNNIVFMMNILNDEYYNCRNNTFGYNCHNNTFGNYCDSNIFGNYCFENIFGDSCDSNIFGNYCRENTFGDSCACNTFGDNFHSNTFGDDCNSNTFGDDCESNIFGNGFFKNTFGNDCYNNTFENYYRNNIISDGYHNNHVLKSDIISTGDITVVDINVNCINAESIFSKGVINSDSNITSKGDITATGTMTSAGFYQSSDERLKTFTSDYDIDLNDIKGIKTGKFYWNSDEKQVINGGVSAQTVEEYFPELVNEDENGFKSVNYDGLAVVAIAAIKKLTERIEQLEEIVRNK